MTDAPGTLTVDQLVGVEHFRPLEEQMSSDLARLRKAAEAISIYRPLHAYRQLRRISSELATLQPRINDWLVACTKVVGQIDVTTMGKVVSAPVVMLSLHMRMLDKQHQYNDMASQFNTLKAFAFGVFALYVSIVSLVATVALGILPLLSRE